MFTDGKNKLMKIGVNSDVVKSFTACYEQFKNQPMDIVADLRGEAVNDACEAIFDYMCKNVSYKLDEDGKQFIKSPARLLADGCGDCKSLTMFVSCCLHCLGIPHIVRFVNFDGSNQYSHVYPVALDENHKEIIMDMCETDEDGIPFYNYARKYKVKKDFIYG